MKTIHETLFTILAKQSKSHFDKFFVKNQNLFTFLLSNPDLTLIWRIFWRKNPNSKIKMYKKIVKVCLQSSQAVQISLWQIFCQKSKFVYILAKQSGSHFNLTNSLTKESKCIKKSWKFVYNLVKQSKSHSEEFFDKKFQNSSLANFLQIWDFHLKTCWDTP